MSFFIPYLLDFPLQDQVGAGLQGPDPILLGAHGARASSSWNLLVPHGGGKLAGRSRRPRQLSAFFIVSQSQRWCCLQCGCAVLGALGLLAGAGVGSWLLGQCWALLSGEGWRTGSGGSMETQADAEQALCEDEQAPLSSVLFRQQDREVVTQWNRMDAGVRGTVGSYNPATCVDNPWF